MEIKIVKFLHIFICRGFTFGEKSCIITVNTDAKALLAEEKGAEKLNFFCSRCFARRNNDIFRLYSGYKTYQPDKNSCIRDKINYRRQK